MSIRFVHRGTRSASRLAWGLIPLAIIIGVLLLLRPPASDPGATATQLESRPGAVLLAVNADSSATAASPMAVRYQADSPDSAKLADVLTEALSQYGLDRGNVSSKPIPDTGGEDWSASIIVHTAQGDEETVRRLLQALAPYFSAQVLLIFDDTRISQLTLRIMVAPAFTEDGLAVFR